MTRPFGEDRVKGVHVREHACLTSNLQFVGADEGPQFCHQSAAATRHIAHETRAPHTQPGINQRQLSGEPPGLQCPERLRLGEACDSGRQPRGCPWEHLASPGNHESTKSNEIAPSP